MDDSIPCECLCFELSLQDLFTCQWHSCDGKFGRRGEGKKRSKVKQPWHQGRIVEAFPLPQNDKSSV